MGIGTSLGAYFEDSMHMAADPFLVKPVDPEKQDNNIVTPPQMRQNQELEKQDYSVMDGIEVKDQTSPGKYIGELGGDEDISYDRSVPIGKRNGDTIDFHSKPGDIKLEPGEESFTLPGNPYLWIRKSKESPLISQNNDIRPADVALAGYKTSSPLVNITDEDIDKATGIALSFSGDGLGGKFPKGYHDKVPIDRRLDYNGVSHPGYRWEVFDKKTGEVQSTDLLNSSRATRSVDRLDNKYGGYRYGKRPVKAKELTEEETKFIKDNDINFDEE